MRIPRLRFLLGALVLAIFAGCEPAPRELVQPPTAPSVDRIAGEYRLIEGRIPAHIGDLSASQLIGVRGGSVHLAGHSITVPPGAVSRNTLFTITLPTNGNVEVELNALLGGLLGRLLNVGADGFGDKTVELSLTYAWAANVGDPQDLVILRMHDDGSVESLPVTVDETGKTVTAQLDHFSRYALASN